MCIPIYDGKIFEDLDCGLLDYDKAEFLDDISFFVNEYKDKKPINDELAEFLRFVLPKTENKYHLIVINDNYTKNYMLPYHKYISALCALANNVKYTLFYNTVAFESWVCSVDAINKFNSLYIDIDDFDEDIDIYSMSQAEVEEFLMKKYNVHENMLPNRVILSGNGMHIYYKVKECNDLSKREYFTKQLLAFYGGDFSCLSVAHQIRVPFSYNCKNGVERKTKLYKIHDKEFKINELKYFEMDEEDVAQAKAKHNAKISAKRNATKAMKKALKELEISNETKDYLIGEVITVDEKELAEFTKKTKKKFVKKSNNSTIEEFDVCQFTYYNRSYYHPQNKNRNLLLDLNNYFIRHNGDLTGKRDLFAFVYANYASRLMSQSECYNELRKYYDIEFFDELEQIVEAVYNRGKSYNYKYTTIAEILDFTQADIDASYCNFSEERKQEALKNKYKRKNDKRNKKSREQKAKDKQLFINNIDKSNKEIIELLGNKYSIRTIQRWRSQHLLVYNNESIM